MLGAVCTFPKLASGQCLLGKVSAGCSGFPARSPGEGLGRVFRFPGALSWGRSWQGVQASRRALLGDVSASRRIAALSRIWWICRPTFLSFVWPWTPSRVLPGWCRQVVGGRVDWSDQLPSGGVSFRLRPGRHPCLNSTCSHILFDTLALSRMSLPNYSAVFVRFSGLHSEQLYFLWL